MTQPEDGGPAGNAVPEITPEEAEQLWAEGDRLFAEMAVLGARADLASAQAEIIVNVIKRRETLAEAEDGLGQARDLLAHATALYDPVAAELEQVETELDVIDPDRAGDLDARLAARQRAYALSDELEPLRGKLARLQREVDTARELVRSGPGSWASFGGIRQRQI